MRTAKMLGAASVAAHGLFFIGAGFLVADLAVLPRVFGAEAGDDWTRLWPYIAETLVGWWPVYVVGVGAATAAGLLLATRQCEVRWFRLATRAAAWLWVPLVPVGPLVGVTLLYLESRRAPTEARLP